MQQILPGDGNLIRYSNKGTQGVIGRVLGVLRDIVVMGLAMAGIRVDKLYAHRLVLLGASGGFYYYMMRNANLTGAIAWFVAVFSLRYLFLFGSFVNGGIASGLKRRFGETRGYEIYETITALMFFNGGACFSCLLHNSAWREFSIFYHNHATAEVAGWILSLAGTTVNLWSGLIIGLDIYYYKDLFVQRFLTDFKVTGPYRVLKNPMYGVGQCAAYGAALMVGSLPGILATAMNQGMMYLFYFTIEKPHVRRMIARTQGVPHPTVPGVSPASFSSQSVAAG